MSSPHPLLPRVRRSPCSRGSFDLSLVPGGYGPHRSLGHLENAETGHTSGRGNAKPLAATLRCCRASPVASPVALRPGMTLPRLRWFLRDNTPGACPCFGGFYVGETVKSCSGISGIPGISIAVSSLDSARQQTQSVSGCRRVIRWGNCRSCSGISGIFRIFGISLHFDLINSGGTFSRTWRQYDS